MERGYEKSQRYVSDQEVPELRAGVRVKAQDESDLRSREVQTAQSASSDVCGGRQPSESTRRKWKNRFPVGLCLGRAEGETIVIHTSDGEIVIGVSQIAGDKTKLVFEAPRSVSIVRSELLTRG